VAAFPFFPQYDQDDCGVMALRMVCHYHKRPVSADRIRELCAVPYGALSLLALSRGAEALGLDTVPLGIPASSLREVPGLPLIIHVQDGHYVVLYRVRGSRLYIADPARGRLCLDRDVFLKEWLAGETIHALAFTPREGAFTGMEAPQPHDPEKETFWSGWTIGTWVLATLETITWWLILKWLGTLFGHIAPGDEGIWSALLITLLLAISLIALQAQWRQMIRGLVVARMARSQAAGRERSPESYRSCHLVQALTLPFHHHRLARRLQGPRAMLLSLVLLAFLAGQAPVAGLFALLGGLVFLILHPWRDIRVYTRWVGAADRELMVLQDFIRRGGLAAGAGFYGILFRLPRPRGLWSASLLVILCAMTVWAWWAGLRPDGFLVILLTTCLYFGYLAAWLDGLSALRMSGYRALPPGQQTAGNPAVFSKGEGELRYLWPEGPVADLGVPAGQSLLLLIPAAGEGRNWIKRLAALHADEGGSLSWQGQILDKNNRPEFWSHIVVLGPHGTPEYAEEGPEAFTDHLRHAGILQALLPGEGTEPARPTSLEGAILHALALALDRDPDILLLDDCTHGLMPFRELIVLENLLALRKGRTTVIASSREELIPSVDLFRRLPADSTAQPLMDRYVP